MQLRTDATGAPGRGAEASASPESPEEDRDSTRSALDKIVNVPVVRVTSLRHGRGNRDHTVADRAAKR